MSAARALTVAHVTAERGFSGGEVQLFLLAEGLRERGHRNIVLCPGRSRVAEEARRRGFEALPVGARPEWSPLAVASVVRQLRRAGPDLVHLHTQRAAWLGGAAARALGLPALATRRMDRPMRRGWRNRFIYGRAASRAVAISEAVAGHLAACGIPAGAIRVVPSAVDPGRLLPARSRAAVREAEGAPADAACLLCAAALIRRKGIDVLLESVARLAERGLYPELWLAGDGPERAALEASARALGISPRIRFLGARADVPDLLSACDAFVLPSRREGLGVAALEAMALARPVVASRVGGLAEAVLHEGTGLLVPPEDPAALADALERLLRDPALRERLGTAGPGRVAERHSAKAMVDAYERLYAEVLAEHAGAGRAGAAA
jgi:glycosyltransferase involved in cell wall biosynthesis